MPSAPAKAVITVRDLRKRFTTHKRGEGVLEAVRALVKRERVVKDALKGVSLTIREGEIVGLLGPNGAGKSTLLKTLCGVLWPDSGKVDILGYTPWRQRVQYVQHIGAVFGQKPSLMWELPPVDSYELYRLMYGIPRPEFRTRLREMIDLLEVQHVINTPVRDLSLGERMRCEAIGALLHNPPLVFLDEPTIGLDIVAKEKLRDFILEMNRKHRTTFIITTHDMQDVEELCERIIVINHGSIIYDGPLGDVRRYFRDKHLDVKFGRPAGTVRFAGTRVVEKTRQHAVLEHDTTRAPIAALVAYLLREFDVQDITIKETPIEEVIKHMYGRRRG
jgi:ABC-2 type transport system ATP-binding protein